MLSRRLKFGKNPIIVTTLAATLITATGCGTSTLSEPGHVAQADAQKSSEVRLVRDDYGVPHIFAESNYGVFFGYGYAVAQDRLFQLEMLRRTAKGQVAEVLGKDYVDFDRFIRTSYDSRSVAQQVEQLQPAKQEVLAGYANGINSYLEKIAGNQTELLPLEFTRFGFEPEPWTAADVAMLFAGSIAHRYSDFNTEIENLQLLQDLHSQHGKTQAWNIFSATKWLYDVQSPTTVPRAGEAEASSNSQAPRYLDVFKHTGVDIPRLIHNPESNRAPTLVDGDNQLLLAQQFRDRGTTGTPGFGSASNLWMVNGERLNGAEGVLVNGPQFGWSSPSYVYGVGLHGGDFDLVGNTLLALPSMLFAHNNHIGWGSTAGFGDQVDIFVEQLNPDNREQYLHQGQYRSFDRWTETIAVKDEKPVTVVARRSIHGMIQKLDADKGIAYAKARAWEGKEVQSLLGWIDLAKIKDIKQVQPVLERIATNINFYIMDKHGNMRYRHGGHYPVRVDSHDTRLPVPGTGEFDWQGMRPGSDNPSVYNPSQNYLVNWNNRPGANWASPDLWWLTWGRGDRADVLIDEITSRSSHTTEQVWQINDRASHEDVNLAYLKPRLLQALSLAQLSRQETQALQAFKSWDGYWRDQDQDGQFDGAGAAIFERWLKQLLQQTLKDDIGERYLYRFAPTGQPTVASTGSVNLQPGTKALIRNLDALESGAPLSYDFFNGKNPHKVIAAAFRTAVSELLKIQGEDVNSWRVKPYPLEFVTTNFRGIPQALDSAHYDLPVIQNRGSENNLFVARGTHIEAWDVFGPGQSGFINASGKRSPHHDDQLKLYQSYGKKRLGFNRAELKIASEEVLHVSSPNTTK
ncbi:penicillin acylase [Pseudomaricurvus alkylphenolicus]|uniref:penicillin acylase family protein n=1 Tax=Pseudomaricurvus alkylphenolicus TaxID=1306991 RepID=UPI0014215D5A|nr:penicillin acylase family protein [Pseudomaricurvus alkylphenolicus]NIB43888.1 penicillin acylase [Pseudomaricurvus alkylphenolicus]